MNGQQSHDLAAHLADYLRLRRALGFKLVSADADLHRLLDYLNDAGAATLTADLAIAWARLPANARPITWARRLGEVRGFARYLATIDPSTEVPPPGVFPGRQHRSAPYIYSPEEVDRILGAARALDPPFRAATIETLLALLAVTGMRVGEALGLTLTDVDLEHGVLTVAGGKSRHPRLLPVHPSTTEALACYVRRRADLDPPPTTSTFFLNRSGAPLAYQTARHAFAQITTGTGLATADVKPRIHDLRHTFAVDQLLGWYRSGEDAATKLAALSTYLGHVKPSCTYWYLSAVPELMDLAAARLETHTGGQP